LYYRIGETWKHATQLRLDVELQAERAYLHRYFIGHNQGRTPKQTRKYLEEPTCDPILASFSLLMGYTATLLEEEDLMHEYHEALEKAIEARGSIVGTTEFCVSTHAFLLTYLGRLHQYTHTVTSILLTISNGRVAFVTAVEAHAFRVTRDMVVFTVCCLDGILLARHNINYGPPVLAIMFACIFAMSVRFLANDPLARANHRVLQALDTLWSGFITHIEPAHLAIEHLHSATSIFTQTASTIGP
jgi:hypothetical protein